MKTNQIYEDYMIPRNLQEHLLRVAALAEIIIEQWIDKKLDKETIVKACIFHDIAKPMTFDLDKQTQFGMSADDIKKLRELQKRIKTKYGTEEHHATVKICEEIGLNPKSVKIVDNLEWKYIPRLLENNDVESLIPIYCDMRIGPEGILPLEERLSELKERTSAEEYKDNLKNGNSLEQLIKNNVKLDINSITDNQINERFKSLLNKEI